MINKQISNESTNKSVVVNTLPQDAKPVVVKESSDVPKTNKKKKK